jgi:hypothetical protein
MKLLPLALGFALTAIATASPAFACRDNEGYEYGINFVPVLPFLVTFFFIAFFTIRAHVREVNESRFIQASFGTCLRKLPRIEAIPIFGLLVGAAIVATVLLPFERLGLWLLALICGNF